MNLIATFAFLQSLILASQSNAFDEANLEPNSDLIITSRKFLNINEERRASREKKEEAEFDALLTETANALKNVNLQLLKKLITVVDKVSNVEKSETLPKTLGVRRLRQHMTATIVEWFHLLLADANEDIIRSKMKGLNKNLFVQFRKNQKLALHLISELAQKSFAAGLTGEEQMILFNVVVENGAIERIKAIALYEMANQMNSNLPDDDSVLKSIADLMVEKVFEAKYHEIEKNFIRENEIDSSPVDAKHANLKVDLLHSNKMFDNIHKKSMDHSGNVHSINIILQALRSRPVRSRHERSAKYNEEDYTYEEVDGDLESREEQSDEEKETKHTFKTRIHGDKKSKLVISQVPITNDEKNVQETIDLNVNKEDYQGKGHEESQKKENIEITIKEKNKDEVVDASADDKKPLQKLSESDITKEFLPKFQKIYSEKSTGPKEKDRQMIQLITAMMSDPRIQTSIIQMLEKHLRNTDVRKATHLVLMAMERTSFGSGEDVLEEMFDTWEPFLSKAIELLGIESLAKVCAIHAAVEKVAKPQQQVTLRLLTKKVLSGLRDRQMAERILNGMSVALDGDHKDILDALTNDQEFLTSDMKVQKTENKRIPLTADFLVQN